MFNFEKYLNKLVLEERLLKNIILYDGKGAGAVKRPGLENRGWGNPYASSNLAPSADCEATKVCSSRGRARRAHQSLATGKIQGGGRLRSSSNRLFWRRKNSSPLFFARVILCASSALFIKSFTSSTQRNWFFSKLEICSSKFVFSSINFFFTF